MLIAHLSDFHLFAPGTSPSALIRTDIADALRRVIADVDGFTPAIDVVALTGDLTDCGTREGYAMLRDVLAPLRARILAIPGNHDHVGNFRRAFADLLPFDEGEFAQYEVVHGGVRFLALDTVIPNRVEGRLCPQRLAWVERKLAEPFAGPTTILMHHPPHTSGLAFFDGIGLIEGADALGRLVAPHGGRVNVLCGHIHRPTQASWHGAFVAVAGSPAFQTALDLHPPAVEPPVVDTPYAYFIYRTNDAGGFAVHPRYVGGHHLRAGARAQPGAAPAGRSAAD